MSKKTLVAKLLQEVQQAKSMYQELVGDDDNDLSKCLFDTKIRAYSHALDLVEYHIHDEKDVLDINQIEKQIIDTVNDFLSCVKPSREANAFVYDVLKQKIILALKDYNRNGGWISIDDSEPYSDEIFCSGVWKDYEPFLFCQIITKDNVLHTVTCDAICCDDGSWKKVFSICTVKNFNGMYELDEISDIFFELDEVKYWQPLPKLPKE